MKNPIVTAGLKCAIETFLKRYTAIATPENGAKAMNGTPRLPPSLASSTIEPVASTTTMKVPAVSARNSLWEGVSLAARGWEGFCNFLYSLLYVVSYFSHLFDRSAFWVFDFPINDVVDEKHGAL